MTHTQRIIARYETAGLAGEPNWDRPDSLRWEDGTLATMADFAAAERGTMSDPHIQYDGHGNEIAVEVGIARQRGESGHSIARTDSGDSPDSGSPPRA